MGSFSVALSGLDTSSVALSVIANNLANMNTVGYKDSTANFQDLFYQQIGSSGDGNLEQVGAGVTVGTVDSQFTQGTIQSTGVPTDVAIQGQGFFVVNNNGTQEYTRAGNFSISSTGQLLTSDGGEVLGYPAVGGVVNTNQAIAPLSIPSGLTVPPKASTEMQVAMTLDSEAPLAAAAASQQPGTGIPAASALTVGGTLDFTDGTNAFTLTPTTAGQTLNDVATAINANANFTANVSGNSLVITAKNGQAVTFSANTLASGANAETFATSGTAVAAGSFSTPLTVYDALGGSHVLTADFTKTASNTWNYTLTIPAADLGQAGNPVTVKTGTFTFNGSGQLTAPTGGTIPVAITGFADGANGLNLTWNLNDTSGNPLISQVSGPSATSTTQTDGYSSGALQTYSVGSDGTIDGVFSNGQTLALGQIAEATFTNPQGLVLNGANSFLASLASGQPSIGTPNTAQYGSLTGGALEQSNVDIATEFSDLILAQRDYQANAQTVTTLDQVSQYAISMIANG